MKKYTFLVFHRDYESFLRRLRDEGVLHVARKAASEASVEQLEQQEELRASINQTLRQAESYLVDDASPLESDNKDLTAEQIQSLLADFASLVSEEKALEQSVAETLQQAQQMAVWGDFSSERLEQIESAGYHIQYFSCPKSQFDEAWVQLYNAFVIAEQRGVTYFVTVNKANEVFDIVADELHPGSKSSSQLRLEAQGLEHLKVAKTAQLQAWALANLTKLRQAAKQTDLMIEWKRVNSSTTTLADDTISMLVGFCPIDKCESLRQMLDQQHIYYIEEDPTEEDETPIKLHNNRFTRMFECLTGMYGWPVYGEFDPTPILAPFFLLFFALCMGDAGYGILLIIFGILTAKKKINIEMFEGLGPIITTLGVGTLVVGFFLGTFFGIDLYTASWVPESLKHLMIKGEVAGYDIQMVMALCIGVVHICLAMTIKAICYTKRFGFRRNVSTWGWLLLILGALVVGILSLTEVFSAQVAKYVLIAIGAISALGIYIFNTPGRNPLINIGAGLWDTYNMATGILGDVLSYIRLYALGLAGGMLGGAFNSLATMVLGETPNAFTWVGFLLIIIIGHLLNLCMSALGAFVHPLRLSFVEYFKNSGYEGKGELYAPFKK